MQRPNKIIIAAKTNRRRNKRIMAANILTDQKLEKNTNLDPEEDEFNGGGCI